MRMMLAVLLGWLGSHLTMASAAAQSAISSGAPVEQVVDCTQGDLIQPVLNASDEASPLVLTIRGVCGEIVQIRRDGVTLKGRILGQASAAISGGVEIYGGQRVVLSSLRVVSGEVGVFADSGSDVRLNYVVIAGHSRAAVAAENRSVVQLFSSTMRGTASNEHVAYASNGSSLKLQISEIQAVPNPVPGKGAAIGLYRQSTAEIHIRNRLEVSRSISNPTRGLIIRAHAGSSALIHGALNVLSGNVYLSQLSGLEVRGTSIQGNVQLERTSMLELNASGAIAGTARLSNRSQLHVSATSAGITGQVRCTGESGIGGAGSSAVTAVGCTALD